MRETFKYRGYSIELSGPIDHASIRMGYVQAIVTDSPKESKAKKCPCSRRGYLSARSTQLIDAKLSKKDQEALAKQYAPAVKKQIKAEIDRHRGEKCFVPIAHQK